MKSAEEILLEKFPLLPKSSDKEGIERIIAAMEEYASQQHYCPTNEQIKKILKKYIYQDGDIYVFYSKRSINKVADEILSLMPEKEQPTDEEIEESRVCPCHYLDEPCKSNCSCIHPFSSAGCNYCATYGSIEQRKAMAKYIKDKLDFHIPTDDEIKEYAHARYGKGWAERFIEGAKAALANEIPHKK